MAFNIKAWADKKAKTAPPKQPAEVDDEAHEEDDETEEDEAAESSEEQAEEDAEGTEAHKGKGALPFAPKGKDPSKLIAAFVKNKRGK
jgi:hypothetical protein